eukprot:552544-Hanusia_phi.AAC.1
MICTFCDPIRSDDRTRQMTQYITVPEIEQALIIPRTPHWSQSCPSSGRGVPGIVTRRNVAAGTPVSPCRCSDQAPSLIFASTVMRAPFSEVRKVLSSLFHTESNNFGIVKLFYKRSSDNARPERHEAEDRKIKGDQ